MNSMAQQAVPNGMGHSDPLRAQLTTVLTVVVRKLSPVLESTAILYPLFLSVRRAGGRRLMAMCVVIRNLAVMKIRLNENLIARLSGSQITAILPVTSVANPQAQTTATSGGFRRLHVNS